MRRPCTVLLRAAHEAADGQDGVPGHALQECVDPADTTVVAATNICRYRILHMVLNAVESNTAPVHFNFDHYICSAIRHY